MHETEINDLADDADYAAAAQQGFSSMAGRDSSKQGYSGEPENAEIIYLKDNVTIHPTQYATERISGRLKLIKQDSLLFLSWIPYKGQCSNARLSERDKNLYTIRAVPFADIRSIRRNSPTIGWQYVIVVLSSGLAFPPLYFYNGGVREFIYAVKQHVYIVRSAEDANMFLVNNFQDPLQRILSSLELPRAIPITKAAPPSSSTNLPSDANHDGLDYGARDISIQVLEAFSLVTRFARDTTTQLFGENVFDDDETEENKNNPQEIVSNDAQLVQKEAPVPPDPLELGKLALEWGKPRQPPLGHEEWATFLDSEGRVEDFNSLKKRIFCGGLEHSLRKEIWPLLLGYLAYDSTYTERQQFMALKKSEYEKIKNQWQSISPEQARRFTKFRERKSLIEKDVVRTDRSVPFYEGDENPNVNLLHNILLTYSFYNFDLGYCQGMSDLLSPILFIMEDESESFWCFVSLMERLGPNFNRDQNGMHSQLFALSKLVELLDRPLYNYFKQKDCLNCFFCFRWILIQFKREFEYEKTLRLWEVLWTHYPSEHLHLYACVAILKRHRAKIIGDQMDFDTLLQYINSLSGQIDLDTVLCDAEALCMCAGEKGATSIPPGTPPSLPVGDESIYQQDDEVL
ncbi:uncharacterized protein [Rutidosis leptorrhynchoides]|uniref:uncharacterized protein isoform X2 n=1 Tax=Rutidosis leptorrhynchoides TaxID=125765 RepID=UPI003A99D7A0